MNKQNGYTLVELLMVIWFLVCVCIGGALLYVLWHFVSKFW